MPGVVRMVGRYEVVRQIGRGGMAVVHLARQVDLDRWVALKELGAFHASEPSLAQRFVRESRVAGSLSHPNIVTVHDFFEYERTPYIAMEYLSQGSLRPYMRGLALPQIVGLLEGVLAGLSHAEGRGVVHRDLKPENLMVTDDGRVKITDFGIAKATDHLQSATYSTAAGTAVGTPAYIAPEQALGEEVGPWTDLYSVGCIAYEAATGQLPFGDTATPAAMLLRHVNEPVVAPRLVRPELEASLSDWIEALLVKAPAARPAAATDAWERLEDIAIQVLGPRWRRDARLPTSAEGSSGAPLRPASFGTPEAEAARPGEEGGAASASAVEYTTHTPAGEPAGPDDVTEGLTTPPGRDADATPPPFGTSDLELDIPVGPDTPAALPAAHAGARRGHAERSAGEAGHGAPPSQGSIGEARHHAVAAVRASAPAAVDPRAAVRAPDELSAGRRRPVRAAAIGAVVVVAGIVAAVLLAGSGDEPRPRSTAPSPTPAVPVVRETLVTGPLTVRLPTGWSAAAPARAFAVLGLRGAAGAAPPNDADGSAVVGLAPARAVRRSLLAAALVRRLPGGRPPAPQRVRLGADGPPAYRYDGLAPRGQDGALTVYAVPTGAGVATVGCEAAAGAPQPSPPCASVARSLAVTGARVYPLGPVARYGAGVQRTIGRLRGALDTATRTLAAAPDAAAQGRAAARLSTAFGAAERRLAGLPVSPADAADTRALAAALQLGGRASGAVADAAGRDDAAAYAAGAGGVARAARRADAALRSLAAAGYDRALRARLGAAALPQIKPPPPTPTAAAPAPTAVPPSAAPTSTPAPAPAPTAAPQPTPTPRPTPIPANPTPIPAPGG